MHCSMEILLTEEVLVIALIMKYIISSCIFLSLLFFFITLLGEQQLICSNISSHTLNKYIFHSITRVINLHCLTECGCRCNIPIDKTAQNKNYKYADRIGPCIRVSVNWKAEYLFQFSPTLHDF